MKSALIALLALATLAQTASALTLTEIGRHDSGVFKKSAAEIPSYCVSTKRLMIVNAHKGAIDVLDLSDPAKPTLIETHDVAGELGGNMAVVNSVSVHGGLMAVAVEADPKTDPGKVAFYSTLDLKLLGSVEVGSLPDMVTFTPDGLKVLVANEGEPNSDYSIDPEGSISVIDLSEGVAAAKAMTLGFQAWNEGGAKAEEVPMLKEKGMRVFGEVTLKMEPLETRPATVSEDLEPEWIEVAPNGQIAYVSLQEANAIAEVDLMKMEVSRLLPLGFKDFGAKGNELDVSDKDGINLRSVPGLYGLYQPDTIRLMTRKNKLYILTANEGDARTRPEDDDILPGMEEGDLFSDEMKLKKFNVEGTPFAEMTEDEDLGRFKFAGDLVKDHAKEDGTVTKLFAFGARSFSIYDAESGKQVFDSGNDFESITAEEVPELFNMSNSKTKVDDRSRSKGPEPEGMAVAQIGKKTYAFIGLERTGGIMIYDVTKGKKAKFLGYEMNRKAVESLKLEDKSPNPEAGDLGPEGLIFIAADESPNGNDLLVVCNEVSGGTVIYEISTK